MQTITPYLLYEDIAAALEWLSRCFGFHERLRFTDPNGTVSHAEMVGPDGGDVMLGHPGPDYESPARTGAISLFVHVMVDDVDEHFQRAKDAGAQILSAPEDQPYGDRRYDAADLEGHRWSFAQHLRDIAPEEWGATTS